MLIDFTKDEKLITEDYLKLVGEWSKWLLGRMYGDELKVVGAMDPKNIKSYMFEDECGEDEPDEDFVIRGKYRDIKAYAEALGKEKEYIISYIKRGKDHPQTAKTKAELDKLTGRFESLTGIMWPFK